MNKKVLLLILIILMTTITIHANEYKITFGFLWE